MKLLPEDELFVENAMMYVSDAEVDAAFEMLNDPELTLEKVCAHFGAGKLVVMALQGKLKEVIVRKGKVAPGLRYVDPWQEPAVVDHNNKHQLAGFSVYRTIERRAGVPQLFERGSPVN